MVTTPRTTARLVADEALSSALGGVDEFGGARGNLQQPQSARAGSADPAGKGRCCCRFDRFDLGYAALTRRPAGGCGVLFWRVVDQLLTAASLLTVVLTVGVCTYVGYENRSGLCFACAKHESDAGSGASAG